MIDRLLRLLLLAGLGLSSLGALVASVIVVAGFVLGARWFWGGVLAAYIGPVCFAAALHFYVPGSSALRPSHAPGEPNA